MKAKAFPHPHVGPVYGCIYITPGELAPEKDIGPRFFMQNRSTRLARCLGIGDRRKRLIINDDLFQGIFSQVTTFGHNHSHRLADIPNLVYCERRKTRLFIVAHVRCRAHWLDQAGKFRSRESRSNAREGPGSQEIEVNDARMRIRATEESRMKESWRAMIVYICPLTSKKTPIFPTFNSCPYKLWSELFHVIASYHNDTPRRTFAEKRTPPPFLSLVQG
jgi:hypothetical protein